ncbi:MAG TPA: LysM peptidoglycan-binding domain-containing protein, partial [Oxalicibacterium sp.]|nr:LysM peptidoglycan-binding domain-containing protein [Oxalicibacterium sp.]
YKVSVAQIRDWNNLSGNHLSTGQKLELYVHAVRNAKSRKAKTARHASAGKIRTAAAKSGSTSHVKARLVSARASDKVAIK